jgi:hypothetical protein
VSLSHTVSNTGYLFTRCLFGITTEKNLDDPVEPEIKRKHLPF